MQHENWQRTRFDRNLIKRINMIAVNGLAISPGRIVGIKSSWLSDLPAAGNHASLILDDQWWAIRAIGECSGA